MCNTVPRMGGRSATRTAGIAAAVSFWFGCQVGTPATTPARAASVGLHESADAAAIDGDGLAVSSAVGAGSRDAGGASRLPADASVDDAWPPDASPSSACPVYPEGPDHVPPPRKDLLCRVMALRWMFLRKDRAALERASVDQSRSYEEHIYAVYLRYRLGNPDALRAFVDAFPVHREAYDALASLESLTCEETHWIGTPGCLPHTWVLGCAAAKGVPGAREKLVRIWGLPDGMSAEEVEVWTAQMVAWHPVDMVRATACAAMSLYRDERAFRPRLNYLPVARRDLTIALLRSVPLTGDQAVVAAAYAKALEKGYRSERDDAEFLGLRCDRKDTEGWGWTVSDEAEAKKLVEGLRCPGLPREAAYRYPTFHGR
jgi:hypothetical protein